MKLKGTTEDQSSKWTEPSKFGLFLQAYFNRDTFIVLAVALVVRLLFMLLMPATVRSFDTYSWETVAKVLDGGANPYQTTPYLNWPPLWLQLIFVLSKISSAYAIPFFRVLQMFLILIESGVLVMLIKLIREVVPLARFRSLVILGIALNPAAILLICQHGNFDVIVCFWLMLFMLALLRYNHGQNYGDWLCACLFLGLGILTKTVPLVLVPLLAGGFRQATAAFRFLGLALVLGPVTLGMSIIYVLSPVDVASKVLAYRSQGGFFGFSGLFHLAGVDGLSGPYNALFYLTLIGVLASGSYLFWSRRFIGDRETVLYAALSLVFIPVFGPGYSPQYLYWFMPFLVATFAFFEGPWRKVLATFGLITACTYLFEYGVVGGDGTYIINLYVYITGNSYIPLSLLQPLAKCESLAGQTLFRLPMFLAYLVLMATGIRMLVRHIKSQPKLDSPVASQATLPATVVSN